MLKILCACVDDSVAQMLDAEARWHQKGVYE